MKITEQSNEFPAQDWKRMVLGVIMGAFIGAVLAWYANQLRQEEAESEEQSSALGTGEMVSLGIETLGLVRTLFRMLKRM